MTISMRQSLTCCVALLVGAAVLFTGCDAFTEGYDEDPNQPREATPDVILTAAQVANILLQEGNFARISGVWAGHFTGADRQYQSLEDGRASAADFDNMWNLAYTDVIAQTTIIQDETSETGNRTLRGIARVLEAQAFGTMTSLFGDVPFEEASQVRVTDDGSIEGPRNPAYDAQEDVYAGIQELLSSAIEDLESGAGDVPGGRDIYFGGDPGPWIEVAHTLKARYYLHTGDYAEAMAEAEQGISDPSGNMIAEHGSSLGQDVNAFYNFVAVSRVGYMAAGGAHAPALLDPGSDDYRGNDKTDETERFATYYAPVFTDLDPNVGAYFADDASYPLVTYSENQLILAEAALLEGDRDAALDALNDVRDVLADTYAEGEYEAYEDGDFGSDEDLLAEILEEKYLTLYGQIEAYNDVRRTDNFIGVPGKRNGEVPQRFIYPQGERDANANVPEDPPGVGEETPVNEQIDYTGVN